MWVFGYGSLMGDGWETERGCIRRTRGELQGYKRAFNKASVRNWGTKENPCPTLNIVKSGSSACRGIAFEFPDQRKRQIQTYLGEREGKGFALPSLAILLDDGNRVDAIVPIYEGQNIIAIDDLPALARKILVARGTSGSGAEYVDGVVRQLKSAGIDDPVVATVANAIAVLLGTASH